MTAENTPVLGHMASVMSQMDPADMAPLTEAEMFRLVCSYPTLAPGGGLSPMPAFCQPTLCADVDIQALADSEQALIAGITKAAGKRKRLLKR